MGTINSLISSYEIPTLFSCDEMEGLYHSLLPAIKKDFPSEQIDPEQYFVARICQNLRLISCVTPNNPILGEQARYICTCITSYVHVYVHYIHMRLYMCMYIHVHVYVHVHVYPTCILHISTCTCMYTPYIVSRQEDNQCTSTCTCTCMLCFVYMY